MSNTTQLRIRFRGAATCYLMYYSKDSCGCDICRQWTDSEKNTFRKDSRSFGYFNLNSPKFERTRDMCPNLTLRLQMVPKSSTTFKTARVSDLNLEVAGKDMEILWKHSTLIDDKACELFMEVYSHIAKESPVKTKKEAVQSPTKFKVTFQGSKPCFLIFVTRSDCRCTKCRIWTRRESINFVNDDIRKFGSLYLSSQNPKQAGDFCWNQEMKLRLIPNSLLHSVRYSDICIRVNGWNHGAIYQDRVEIDSEMCTVKIEILKDDTAPLPLPPPPSPPSLPRPMDDTTPPSTCHETVGPREAVPSLSPFNQEMKPVYYDSRRYTTLPDVQQSSKLKMTFRVITPCYLVFTTMLDCKCSLCSNWTCLEVGYFKEGPRYRRYGFISIEEHCEKVFDLCWRHDLRVKLVYRSDRENLRYQDLNIAVRGFGQSSRFTDTVGLCRVDIEFNASSPRYYEAHMRSGFTTPTSTAASAIIEAVITTTEKTAEPRNPHSLHAGADATVTASMMGETKRRNPQGNDALFPAVICKSTSASVVNSHSRRNPHERYSIPSVSSLRILDPLLSTSTSGEPHGQPQSVRKLEMTFLGIPKFYLAFHTTSNCRCGTCNDWTALETTLFRHDGGVYGVIASERMSEARTLNICPNHEIKMGLVSWDRRDDAKMTDLVMFVDGEGEDATWEDFITIGSDICTVSILLLDAAPQKLPKASVASTWHPPQGRVIKDR